MQLINYKVKKEDFIKEYLEVFNGIMKLTDVELSVLNELVKLFFEIRGDKEETAFMWKQVFNSESRKEVAQRLNFKSRTNVDYYIKKLRDKKIISTKNGYNFINKVIIPKNEFGFKFIVEE
jgi:hypothetical protein